MMSEVLTQLPKSAFDIGDPVVLGQNTHQEDESVRLVINCASRAFESYEIRIGEQQFEPRTSNGMELPLIIERTQESIPTHVGRGVYTLEQGIQWEEGTKKPDCGGKEQRKRQRMLDWT